MAQQRGTRSSERHTSAQVARLASAPSNLHPPRQQSHRTLIATLIGNALENYDFAIYAAMCLLVSAAAVWLLEETGAREAN